VARVDTAYPLLKDRRHAATAAALAALFAEMQPDVQARYDSGAKQLVSQRWDDDLAEVVFAANMATATEVAHRVAQALGVEFNQAVMRGWFTVNSVVAAHGINERTANRIADNADVVAEPVAHVFGQLLADGAKSAARQMVTVSSNFAARDVAEKVPGAVKVWKVNSKNPRSAHAALNGQSVPTRGQFSNGMEWPGDPAGGAANNAHCKCSITIVK
jgi:hypothetical protein